MSFTVLIPARLGSTRLARKPLSDLGGLPMIVRVARRAALSAARGVVVAADDTAIMAACEAHGVAAVLTRITHMSGSDRLAEACDLLGVGADDIVVNLQGDEPLIDPALIDGCASLLIERRDCVMSTAAHPITTRAEFDDPNVVKVVLDLDGRALYFSRATIPFLRDPHLQPDADLPSPAPLRHVGLYAYRARFLRAFAALTPSPLERIESLEQLRVLWHGERIAVHVSDGPPAIGIDTPEDLARARAMFA